MFSLYNVRVKQVNFYGEPHMKKLLVIILSICLLCSAVPAFAGSSYIVFFENCGITSEENIIYGVPEKTPYTEISSRILTPGTPSYTDYGSTGLVTTGTTVTVNGIKGTFVIKADINSDGRITSTDYLLVKKSFSTTPLTGLKLTAGDLNRDGKISSVDYIGIRSYMRGKYPLPTALPEMPEGNDISVVTPTETEKVHIANASVRGIMTLTEFTTASVLPYADGNNDIYYPEAVTLKWISRGENYKVSISTDPNMTGSKVYEGGGHSLTLTDLFGGTRYFYRIETENGESPVKYFETAAEPRTISIDGVSNSRDIGGYVTKDGTKKIKQGILYRTAQLNNITDQGVIDLKDKYAVKTEIDLSGGGNTSSLLTGVIRQEFWSIKSYSEITNISLQSNLKNALEVFADANAYPVLFHCMAGRDRTGTIAAILLAISGVDELTIYRDYHLTYTSWWGNNDNTRPEELNMMMYTLLSLFEEEEDLQQAMTNFLIDEIGLSEDTINKIVNNITEPV